jgi:endonuclease/exonuclease/phosphatase family metal-dependent hydrolase
MKTKAAFLILILVGIFNQKSYAQGKINVMTFNIRFDNPADGDDQWKFRKANLASMIQFYDVEICGMQEVLFNQAEDLKILLPDYKYVGVGRSDGKKEGEYSPIFYDAKKITIIESQTFWLSTTPSKPSKGWDANLPRIVTWAKMKYKDTEKGKKPFYVFNTHFDHLGKQARAESAKLLLKKVKEIAGNQPAIITGDFNATPLEEPIQIIKEVLIDARGQSKNPHFGPSNSTFNAFDTKETEGRLIDFIFLNSYKLKVIKHATLSNNWNGHFASDHHAVMARIDFD